MNRPPKGIEVLLWNEKKQDYQPYKLEPMVVGGGSIDIPKEFKVTSIGFYPSINNVTVWMTREKS